MSIADFAAVGYFAAAIAYGFLGILVLVRLRRVPRGGYLLAACAVSATWAVLNGLQARQAVVPVVALWAAEGLWSFTWLFFLLAVLAPVVEQSPAGRHALKAARVVLFGLVSVILLSLDETWGIGTLLARGEEDVDVKLIGQLLLAVAGITLVEQVLRNVPAEPRQPVKYLCIGLGAIFIYDFYFYADALLFRRLDADIWRARGFVNALAVPLLMVAAARSPEWSMPISLSRRAVLHTTALLGTGIYLLGMAVTGYYIRLFGGEWGPVLRASFLFIASVILATLFVSRKLRAHLRVLINKHFFRYRYDYRDEWLKLIATLTGRLNRQPLHQRVIAALGEIVESPGGVLFLVTERGDCRVGGILNLPQTDLAEQRDGDSLVAFLRSTRWVVDIEEYRSRPATYGGLELPRCVQSLQDAWLIVPLIHDDRLTGFVVLTRPRVVQELDWESLDLLKTAGLQAASYLALSQAAESLAEARQFEGFNRLSAFVMHDLKNLIAQLSLVVTNAQRHKTNPAFVDDAIGTIENSVAKMSRLMAHLRLSLAPPAAQAVDLGPLLADVVATHQSQKPAPRLVNRAGAVAVRADPDRLSSVFGHIVQNAQDATPSGGTIEVRLERTAGHAIVAVQDDGTGMDEAFVRERLFRPFDSTKGLTGMGIGAYECREFVKSLGGWIDVKSIPGAGTTFTIGLPVASQAALASAVEGG